MHLVQILLPLQDEHGHAFAAAEFQKVAHRLTERFGGVTSYTRSPAEGRWKDAGATETDDIVVVEVMVEHIDRAWWAELRNQLEEVFRQDEIIIRAQEIERL